MTSEHTNEAEAGEIAGRSDATEATTSAGERRWLSTALIVLATVVAVVATMTTWVRTELLDTDEWVGVSSDLLAEPQVQEALTTYLSNQLFERVALREGLEEVLPEPLAPLAGAFTGMLRDPITNGIGTFIASDRFAELWETANRAAHGRMVAILRDEGGPNVSSADGAVTLDLGGVLAVLAENLGLPTAAIERIPADAGQVVIFESDELAAAQTVVQIFDFLSWFLFLAVVALYGAAIAVAGGRRVAALRNVGVAMAIGGVVLLILRAVGIRAVTGVVVKDPTREPLGELVAEVGTELLRQTSWVGIVYGLLIALFALLIGDHGWARAIRSSIGRVTQSRGAAIGVAAGAILLMLWWSPGRVFDRWVTALTFTVLVVGGVTVLLSRSRRERALQLQ